MIVTTCTRCHTLIRLDPNLGVWVGDDKSHRCDGDKSEFSAHLPNARFLVLSKVWDIMNEEAKGAFSPHAYEYMAAIANSFHNELAARTEAGRHHPVE